MVFNIKTVQQVINEADILVPNVLSVQQKLDQLNNLTNEFYNNVKVPSVISFSMENGTEVVPVYDMRDKDINYVQAGFLVYKNDDHVGTFNTGNRFDYDNETRTLTLKPSYPKAVECVVRYYKSQSKIYTTSNLDTDIDAPSEFQQSFVPALASWIALTQDDISRASVYEAQYRSVWNAASQNYGSEQS